MLAQVLLWVLLAAAALLLWMDMMLWSCRSSDFKVELQSDFE